MKKQKIMSQMKRQDKATEKQLKKVEIENVPESEFRIMTVKMIQGLGKRMEKMQENFTTDLEVVLKVTSLLAMRETWVQSLV